MYLLTTATNQEMCQLKKRRALLGNVDFLVSGVGLVETTLSLTRYLSQSVESIDGVINFGVAGAFCDTGVEMLDICLAQREIFGDFGICFDADIMDFGNGTVIVEKEFNLQNSLYDLCAGFFNHKHIEFKTGNFLTVNSVSGTQRRGNFLRDKYQGICENMEGAAVARVCQSFDVPCLELRCVSNMVEDRDTDKWKLSVACEKISATVSVLIKELASLR